MPSEPSSLEPSYFGHVKNGVVVFDAQTPLREGQSVRVEPLPAKDGQADRIEQLRRLFADWTEEDGKLPEEQADVLREALEQHRGLSFHSPTMD
jgi:hypothetical protein